MPVESRNVRADKIGDQASVALEGLRPGPDERVGGRDVELAGQPQHTVVIGMSLEALRSNSFRTVTTADPSWNLLGTLAKSYASASSSTSNQTLVRSPSGSTPHVFERRSMRYRPYPMSRCSLGWKGGSGTNPGPSLRTSTRMLCGCR